MKKILNLFTQHPKSIGETYLQHLIEALYCGSVMIIGGILCIIHGILPFLFVTSTSSKLVYLIKRFEKRYNKDLMNS